MQENELRENTIDNTWKTLLSPSLHRKRFYHPMETPLSPHIVNPWKCHCHIVTQKEQKGKRNERNMRGVRSDTNINRRNTR